MEFMSVKKNPGFVDRAGHYHVPGNKDVIISREGAFGVCLSRQSVLMTWEPDDDLAKIPGGGIEPGETPWQAFVRELEEETGAEIKNMNPLSPVLTQSVDYFAKNFGQFWRYGQTFYRLLGAAVDALYFEGETPTPEGGTARWVALSALDETEIHYVHANALHEVLKNGIG